MRLGEVVLTGETRVWRKVVVCSYDEIKKLVPTYGRIPTYDEYITCFATGKLFASNHDTIAVTGEDLYIIGELEQ